MEEEAKRSNSKTTNIKTRVAKKIESDKSDHSDHKKRRIKADAKLKEIKEDVKEVQKKQETVKDELIKHELSPQNVTVGNIFSAKGSSSGEQQVIKYAPIAFRPPSFKNTGGDESIGFMPINSIEGQKSLNFQPNMSNSKIISIFVN